MFSITPPGDSSAGQFLTKRMQYMKVKYIYMYIFFVLSLVFYFGSFDDVLPMPLSARLLSKPVSLLSFRITFIISLNPRYTDIHVYTLSKSRIINLHFLRNIWFHLFFVFLLCSIYRECYILLNLRHKLKKLYIYIYIPFISLKLGDLFELLNLWFVPNS